MKKTIFLIFLTLFIQAVASSQPCLSDGITFTTQAQIDNFQSNYPNCTEIEGDVEISGNSITNLNGLNILNSFGGNFRIEWNYSLISLAGLDNITSIEGSLELFGTSALTNITSLENLEYIGEDIIIWANFTLTSLEGLEGLTSIEGDIVIVGSQGLVNLTGLDNITSIGGDLEIGGSMYLTSLDGLESLNSIGGDLIISTNFDLANLSGLENLSSIGGNITIEENDVMSNLTGLESLASMTESLIIEDNISLTNLTGLDNLEFIGGGLSIINNDELTSLTGLDKLNSVIALSISHNDLLSDLGALSNLDSEEEIFSLVIGHNPALTSLSGLDNINFGSVYYFWIYNNSYLSTCAVQSVCNYLANPSGDITISSNAPGCNSQEEVEEACETLVSITNERESQLLIYPNPADEKLFISRMNETSFKEIFIYSLTGHLLLSAEGITDIIDISSLKRGMYVIELVSNEDKIRKKFIVK